jgi:hypothetical protein
VFSAYLNHSSNSTNRLERVFSTTFSKQCDAMTAISTSLVLCSRVKTDSTGSKTQRLAYMPVTPLLSKTGQDKKIRDDQRKARTAWFPLSTKRPTKGETNPRRVASLLPLEIELIVLGYSKS